MSSDGRLPRRRIACVAACLAIVSWVSPEFAHAEDETILRNELGLTPKGRSTLDALIREAETARNEGRYVRAREIADSILRIDPDSPFGHGTLGIVLHRAEGSLPRALYHLTRSLEQFEVRYGPARYSQYHIWHLTILQETAQLNGAIGRNEEKLKLLDQLEQQGDRPIAADRGWPLMRLRRYDEARSSVEQALGTPGYGYFGQRITAYNAICAIEGELQHREETYLACLRSAQLDRAEGDGDPVAYTNAAIGALAMLKVDEAERLILEGTEHFSTGTVSNPWLDLMILYIGQGRMPEALDAMRRMFEWRNSQPPYMEEQNRAQSEMASAMFLLVAGHPFEAARISRRALDRPDRTGYTSSDSEQMESAAALVYTVSCRTAAQLRREEASSSPFLESIWLNYDAFRLELRAWAAARRAAALLAGDRILVSTVRPYLPGGSEISEWIQLELPRLLGPGVVAAAVEKARSLESLERADGYFLAFDAEVAWQRGDAAKTLDRVDAALAALPRPEVQITAHLSAIGARAAWMLGNKERAYALLSQALQIDPGVLRRLDIELPVRFRAGESAVARRTLELLQNSPRLIEGGAFIVETLSEGENATACLLGPQGEVYGCGYVTPRPEEDTEALARRLAQEFHQAAFAPRIDLTQADIQSLDGSPTAAGGRNRERMRIILDGLVGSDPRSSDPHR